MFVLKDKHRVYIFIYLSAKQAQHLSKALQHFSVLDFCVCLSLQLLTSVTLSIPKCHWISLPPLFIQKKKKRKNPPSLKAMYFPLCLQPPAKADASLDLQGVSVKVVEAPAAVITDLKKVCLPFVTSQKCMLHQKMMPLN